nr:MAG TPA_asm: hypothetical protein [Bacteriophage sp.]DAP05612.1 MAG TPA: hypothetical protein [Caudoviricetes sp.]
MLKDVLLLRKRVWNLTVIYSLKKNFKNSLV